MGDHDAQVLRVPKRPGVRAARSGLWVRTPILFFFNTRDTKSSSKFLFYIDERNLFILKEYEQMVAQIRCLMQEMGSGFLATGAATAEADEVPPGWTFYEPLGRYLDPTDSGTWGKVPRNAACPCAAGKKYKHCHGRVA